MINLNLKRNETRFRNVEKDLLTMFHSCGTGKSNKNFRFAKVDSNFVNFLPYLKDGAVKLYLYYAAAANNDTGESWHSIDTISKKLSATERSIGNWNNQLENMGLIYRTSIGKRSKATFVLPLTGFAVKMSASQMEQALTELNLYTSNEHSSFENCSTIRFSTGKIPVGIFSSVGGIEPKTISSIIWISISFSTSASLSANRGYSIHPRISEIKTNASIIIIFILFFTILLGGVSLQLLPPPFPAFVC